MKEKNYREQLHETITKYVNAPSLATYGDFLAMFFIGIKENEMLPVKFYVNCEEMDGGYNRSDHVDGSVLEVFTIDVDKIVAADNRLRAMVKELKKCDECAGIMLNPEGDYEIFVPRELILNAIEAGYQIAMDEIEAEAQIYANNNSPHDVIWRRPVDEEVFAAIADRIQTFVVHPDDYLKISYLDDDEVMFAQVIRSEDEGERHLSFGFSMDDFGWDKPLVLGKKMATNDAISLLRRVCVDGENPDDTEEIMSFKSMISPSKG